MKKTSPNINDLKMFEFIINSSDDAIMSKTMDGVITSWNPGSEKLFGYAAKDVIGHAMLMLLPDDRKNEEKILLAKLAQGKTIDHFETVRICKDGSAVDVSVTISPILDNNGKVIGASKIARNISALKETERNLSQKNEQLKNHNWLQEGIVILHESVRGNQNLQILCQIIITTIAKYVGAKVGVMYLIENNILKWKAGYAYPKKSKDQDSVQLGEGIVGQAAIDKKIQHIDSPNGNELIITSSIIKTAPQEIVAVPLIFNEETIAVIELGSLVKFTQIEIMFLQKSAEALAILLNSALGAFQIQKLLGETQEQSEELLAQQEELKASNEELEEKTKILIESENELKTQSEELQASNEELEEKSSYLEEKKQEVENKNIELETARKAVDKKAKELEKTGAYKSEFLANMSHELRTPLNSLLILSKSLADNDDGNLTEEQIEECAIIHSGGQELLTLINDILDLSKVEAGKMELLLEGVVIENFANNLLVQFKHVANQKCLSYEVNISRDLPEILKMDEQKTSQILKNLLSNAFKFTKSGSVQLHIHKPSAEQSFNLNTITPDNAIAFSVIDSGIGIPQNKQEEIFEAFKQVDGSTSREYGGTGLGLTISRQLAQLMGGEIQLNSQENNGTTFTLYLPKKINNLIEKTPKLEPQKSSQELNLNENGDQQPISYESGPQWIEDDRNKIATGSNILLIIDDDINFAKILLKEGRSKGFVCIVAKDGSSGLGLAVEYKPNAILLDLGLPDMTGKQVLHDLKQNVYTRHIPVHVISAADENIALMKTGAIGFLQKPPSNTDLDTVFKGFEKFSNKAIKRLLIVEDDIASQRAIKKLFKNDQIDMLFVANGKEAFDKIQNENFDSIILDLKLPDMSGFDLLDLCSKEQLHIPPVIVYTGKVLTDEEYNKLRRFASSIVVKGADSPERLMDEVSLFLHSVDNNQQKETNHIAQIKKPLEGKKVLLVDDDMRNLFALSKVLKKNGLTVEMAKDGQFALNALAKDKDIELVIMDIMMPVMDGYTAIEKIRAQPIYKNLPIIALTAKAMPEDRQKCIDVGASDYLSKPVDVDRLISLMCVWLGKV